MRERVGFEREDAPLRERRQEPPEVPLLALQRAAGNQAVTAMLQRFKRGAPEAPTEYEYDSETIVKTVQPPGNPAPPPVQWTLTRPKQASGPFGGVGVPARPATAMPLAYGQTSGAVTAENRLLGYDGGHVIGLHLGGENIGDNVVPMFPGFNRGVWKNMEDALKAHALTTPGPHRMMVDMTYGAATAPEVPTTFTVTSETRAATGVWVQALPPRTLTQPADIAVTAPLAGPAAALVQPRNWDRTNPLVGQFDGSAFILGNETFAGYVNRTGHLPPAQRPLYPDQPVNRPYELLDILVMNGGITDTTLKGAGVDFAGPQRELILQTNMARNGGRLHSDDPNDPHQWLDERGTADAPEIDHIVPKSQGGSNLYSNARVVSWQLNNKEARVKPLAGLVDTRRLALPVLPNLVADKVKTIVEQALLRDVVNPITAAAIAQWGTQTYNVPVTPRMQRSIVRELQALVAEGALVDSGGGVFTRA